jgi:hypothetical protein
MPVVDRVATSGTDANSGILRGHRSCLEGRVDSLRQRRLGPGVRACDSGCIAPAMGSGGLHPHIGQPPGVTRHAHELRRVGGHRVSPRSWHTSHHKAARSRRENTESRRSSYLNRPTHRVNPLVVKPRKTRPKPPVNHYSFLEDTPSSKYHLRPPHTVFEVSFSSVQTVSRRYTTATKIRLVELVHRETNRIPEINHRPAGVE